MATKINFKVSDIAFHSGVGLLIRLLLSIYSVVHDSFFKLPYTDVDYKVFSQAAKQVLAGRSPYDQRAYRYSPLVAYLCAPNVLLHPVCGKLVASAFDVYLAYRIYRLVCLVYGSRKKAVQCAQLWLYNPLAVIVCTRGNVDSVSSVFVLLALLYHLKGRYLWSGALLGVSTHLRLYPVVFALPFMITCGRHSKADTLRRTYKSKLQFVVAFAVTVAALTGAFYYVYGYKFVDASILYHITRQDIRHNFSLYFYMQYLDGFVPDYVSQNVVAVLDPKFTKNLLIVVPNVVVQLALAVKYDTSNHLPFNLFCSAFVFVIFNKVLTSQYFVWFLALLPVFLPSIVLSTKKVVVILGSWCAAQALWLLAAYLLEFEGYNTFIYIHACSVLFFAVNIWILITFINSYNTRYFKKVD